MPKKKPLTKRLPPSAKTAIYERAVKRRTTGLGFDVLQALEEQESTDTDVSDARRFVGRPDY